MKLLEIAEKVIKQKENEAYIDLFEFGESLGLSLPYLEQTRLKAYWITKKLDSDTEVGMQCYFLDDHLVAFSYQTGRKSAKYIEWAGKKEFANVKGYLASLWAEAEMEEVPLCDFNKEEEPFFRLHYNTEVLDAKKVYHKGKPVIRNERIKDKEYGMDTMQRITLSSGEVKEVDVSELEFGYFLT